MCARRTTTQTHTHINSYVNAVNIYIYIYIYTCARVFSFAITDNAVLYSALFVSILALWPTAQLATAEGTFATYAEALLEGDSLGAISMVYR